MNLMQPSPPKIVVLGGGISGLSAAWSLYKTRPDAAVELWEKGSRLGGVLETIDRAGFQFEQSADNFITTEPWAIDLCKEVGLGDEIVPTNNQFRRTFVVRKGSLYPLPDGFMMMAPTKLFPLAFTPLLSPIGKLRAGLELLLPRREKSDESLGQFVSRRLGREVYDRIVEPLVSGIYAGDADRLSVWATLPRFPEMEQKYRSLILAMKSQQSQAKKIKREEVSGARYSFFVALRRGLSSLVQAIADRLPAGAVVLSREAVRMEPIPGHCNSPQKKRWRLTDNRGEITECDGVVVATGARPAAALFESFSPAMSQILRQVELSSAVVLTVGYKTEQIKRPINGMGFVVPVLERSPLIAGSFSSHKYPHRAPPGHTLIRLFAGGTRSPHLAQMDESELLPLLLTECSRLLKIEGNPVITEIARWSDSMPQYNIGHIELRERFQDELANFPSLAFAGNVFTGVGIPTCIRSGQMAAGAMGHTF